MRTKGGEARGFFGAGWPEIDKGGLISLASLYQINEEELVSSIQQAFTNIRIWLRGLDLNQRPSGYEPERSSISLADCIALPPATSNFSTQFTRILDPYWTHGAGVNP